MKYRPEYPAGAMGPSHKGGAGKNPTSTETRRPNPTGGGVPNPRPSQTLLQTPLPPATTTITGGWGQGCAIHTTQYGCLFASPPRAALLVAAYAFMISWPVM